MVRRLGESSKRHNEKSGNVTLFKDGLWKFSGGFNGLFSELWNIFNKDEAAMNACIEYCNSFGDPLIEEPFISPRDVADTMAQVVEAEYNDASDVDDFAVYIGDYRNGVNIEILDANYRRAKSFESKITKRSGRKLKENYYDPELDQFEIYLMTRGTDGHDEIREYVNSRRDTGIFGSTGSEYGNFSVWVNTESIDDEFMDEVEALIDFAQDHGARLNVKCFNELKDLFTVKHAPYDI